MKDFDILITSVCVGISATCATMYIIYALMEVKIEKQDGEEVRELPATLRLFMPFIPNFMSIARGPSFDATRESLDAKIIMAGYENAIDGTQFIALKFVMATAGIIFGTLVIISGKPLFGVLMILLPYVYPDVWLKKTIQKRHLSIQRALPNVLDLLTLSVEAGKDFLTSLRDILARRKRDPLGEELERTFREIQLGKKRTQALKDLVKRVKQPDLSSVMNSIIQSDELGVSIAQLLRIQGDQLRMKRFQRAEKLANEAPVKMIFPIALFIFPAVIIIMGTPLLMQITKVLFK